VEHNVAGLEIPVHDVVVVQDLQPADDVAQDFECFLFGQPAQLLDVLLQVAPVAVLADQVQVALRAESQKPYTLARPKAG
jgi:hypothetical protein